MAGLGILDKLAEPISSAVISSKTNEELATGLNEKLSQWFQGNVFPIMTGAAIFITVLFVFYGAFLYFTAYGDENRATQAKKTLTYAIVGFAISALAFSIANYSKRLFITEKYEQGILNDTSAGSGGSAAESPSDIQVITQPQDGTIGTDGQLPSPYGNPLENPGAFEDIQQPR